VKNILAIFTPKPEPEAPKPEPKGGLDELRGRAGAHARLPQGANWLKEALHISGDELNRFLAGGDLPLPKIALLIAYLGVKAEYLPDLDLLRSTAEPAFPMGNPPDRYVPPAKVDAPRAGPAFSPETPHSYGMLKPVSLRKPGWA
jgi:hypothetical protein